MDGYEATKRLKAGPTTKGIPVIAVTASSFREEEARARKICDGFIRKPFNRSELVAELKRFLKPIEVITSQDEAPVQKDTSPAAVSAEALARRPALLERLHRAERKNGPLSAERETWTG
jgi:CheY-like chemotaxis protein